MGAIKYLAALWAGVVVYVTTSLFTGALGFSAYEQLLIERDKQESNMDTLRRLNKELENAKDALLYDRETIAVYARELGFAFKDEKFIRIVGLGGAKKDTLQAGQIITALKPRYAADRNLRILSFCVGLGVFVCMVFSDLFRLRDENARRG
jgi:cell division protein FtsB